MTPSKLVPRVKHGGSMENDEVRVNGYEVGLGNSQFAVEGERVRCIRGSFFRHSDFVIRHYARSSNFPPPCTLLYKQICAQKSNGTTGPAQLLVERTDRAGGR